MQTRNHEIYHAAIWVCRTPGRLSWLRIGISISDLNIRANPTLDLEIADQRYSLRYRVLRPAEAYEVLTAWEDGHPWESAGLQRLLKIDYDRSEAARRAFTESLLFVSFTATHC